MIGVSELLLFGRVEDVVKDYEIASLDLVFQVFRDLVDNGSRICYNGGVAHSVRPGVVSLGDSWSACWGGGWREAM